MDPDGGAPPYTLTCRRHNANYTRYSCQTGTRGPTGEQARAPTGHRGWSMGTHGRRPGFGGRDAIGHRDQHRPPGARRRAGCRRGGAPVDAECLSTRSRRAHHDRRRARRPIRPPEKAAPRSSREIPVRDEASTPPKYSAASASSAKSPSCITDLNSLGGTEPGLSISSPSRSLAFWNIRPTFSAPCLVHSGSPPLGSQAVGPSSFSKSFAEPIAVPSSVWPVPVSTLYPAVSEETRLDA